MGRFSSSLLINISCQLKRILRQKEKAFSLYNLFILNLSVMFEDKTDNQKTNLPSKYKDLSWTPGTKDWFSSISTNTVT